MSQPRRSIARIVRTPPPAPGFAGPGHTAVEVLTSRALTESDPFVLLMDDRLDFAPGQQVGGAHPHAGLETVTLVLDGSMADREEGVMSRGDVAWMTAGRGIIHNEHVEARGPFVGGDMRDIQRLHERYNKGTFTRLSTLTPLYG